MADAGLLEIAQAADASPVEVVLGMPCHNAKSHLAETLRSVLAQTHRSFRLVVLDDASDDGSLDLARALCATDPRVAIFRSDRRLGMVQAWREVFALARRSAPGARYFAWVSDHDLLSENWLEALLVVRRRSPAAVIVHPSVLNISTKGVIDPKRLAHFVSPHAEPVARFWSWQVRGVGFGNIIYGLIDVASLERTGVFHAVLAPDRLTVLQLALLGDILLAPKAMRYRRKTATFSLARQKRSLFPGPPPAYSHLAFFVQHAFVLIRWNPLRGDLKAQAAFVLAVGAMLVEQSWRQTVGKWEKARRRRAAAISRANSPADNQSVGAAAASEKDRSA